MKKRSIASIALASLLTVGALVLSGCGSEKTVDISGKMKVVTTVYPVYDVAKAVGGDKIDLTMLVAPGMEPHDWEPTVNDMKDIGKAKIFMYSGYGLEPVQKLLAKDIIRDAQPIELAKESGVKPLTLDEEDNHDHEHNHENEHGHSHAHDEDEHHHELYDPHVWMNPENIIKETKYTAEIFAKADPANAEYYQDNANAYIQQLQELNQQIIRWRADADVNTLVVSHLAFGYFTHQYDMKQEGIMGVAPEAEPTPSRMADITSFVKNHHVKAIFSEELVNPKLANAIAKETGAKVYMLNPIEAITPEQMKNGDNYVSLMQANLATLKEAFPVK